MIGLFVYNPPQILEAVREAGKLDQITIVAFDEADDTLQAIKDGLCVGTVVQDPYNYGYKSAEVLKAIIEGDDSVIPESKFINLPARMITKENVDEFWAKLRAQRGG